MRRLVLLACLLPVSGAAGCSSGGETSAETSVRVVATTTQLADFARAVGGPRVRVDTILGRGADPHDYEPRPSDAQAVAEADLVLRSGGDLDGWLTDVVDGAGGAAAQVTLADAIGARGEDPHWWQDPRNAIVAVGEIRDALIAADPSGRADYSAAAAHYVEELRALDGAIAACMRAIPAAKRRLVTDHDALGYFADRYDIEVVGTVIPALSTQAQASAGEIARLARAIRAAGVRTIFPQSSVGERLTRAVARDAGATVGPPLYADTLGAKGSAGETYTGSLRFNARALAAGFTGDDRRCQL